FTLVSFNLGSVSINLSSAPLLVAVNSSQKQRMMSRRTIYDVTPLQLAFVIATILMTLSFIGWGPGRLRRTY
ncbi:MAG TPA: hypothetical protein V6C89_14970, partial [Drouetiella sp.]